MKNLGNPIFISTLYVFAYYYYVYIHIYIYLTYIHIYHAHILSGVYIYLYVYIYITYIYIHAYNLQKKYLCITLFLSKRYPKVTWQPGTRFGLSLDWTRDFSIS